MSSHTETAVSPGYMGSECLRFQRGGLADPRDHQGLAWPSLAFKSELTQGLYGLEIWGSPGGG